MPSPQERQRRFSRLLASERAERVDDDEDASGVMRSRGRGVGARGENCQGDGLML